MNLRDRLDDGAWLSQLLEDQGRWTGGPIDVIRAERTGLGFGLSGEIHRLHATRSSGEPTTLVAKIESAGKTRRALAARRQVERVMRELMPACYGSHVDDDEGLLLLHDVNPAIQGDELEPCGRERAVALVHALARLHAHTFEPMLDSTRGTEVWQAAPTDAAWWATRVETAAARYPMLFDHDRRRRVEQIRDEIADAVAVLRNERISWIHVDPHLDNVLWRPDGSMVLLDWSNARIGPTAVDVAVMVFSLACPEWASLTPDELIDVYAAEMARLGHGHDRDRLAGSVRLATVVYLQGIVGWAGEPSNDGFHDRKATLRDESIGRALRALQWLDAA